MIVRVPKVKRSLWIGTADIKDLYVEERPFLGLLADLIKKGKEVRLIHAKEPGLNFREDFDHYPILFTGLERALCPRVHFKIIIFDLHTAYIGSANLTGAGMAFSGIGAGCVPFSRANSSLSRAFNCFLNKRNASVGALSYCAIGRILL